MGSLARMALVLLTAPPLMGHDLSVEASDRGFLGKRGFLAKTIDVREEDRLATEPSAGLGEQRSFFQQVRDRIVGTKSEEDRLRADGVLDTGAHAPREAALSFLREQLQQEQQQRHTTSAAVSSGDESSLQDGTSSSFLNDARDEKVALLNNAVEQMTSSVEADKLFGGFRYTRTKDATKPFVAHFVLVDPGNRELFQDLELFNIGVPNPNPKKDGEAHSRFLEDAKAKRYFFSEMFAGRGRWVYAREDQRATNRFSSRLSATSRSPASAERKVSLFPQTRELEK